MKKGLAILLVVLFVVSLTAVAASAERGDRGYHGNHGGYWVGRNGYHDGGNRHWRHPTTTMAGYYANYDWVC
jgi:hypothetical protein